jgi:hypothetical protein
MSAYTAYATAYQASPTLLTQVSIEGQISSHARYLVELRTELNIIIRTIELHKEQITELKNPPNDYCAMFCSLLCLIPLYFFNAFIYMKIIALYQ